MQNHFSFKRVFIGLVICLIADKQAAMAVTNVSVPEADPEIIASSWDDNDDRYACITLNGKELLRFKESAASDNTGLALPVRSDASVEDRAEDIAAKLDQLVKSKQFSADKLYPIKTKDGVVFKVDNSELFKLSASDLTNSISIGGFPVKQLPSRGAQDVLSQSTTTVAAIHSSLETKSLEYGLKIANTIREAFGAKALPVSFLKLAQLTARRGVNSLAAVAAAGASVSGQFSGTASWYGPHFHGRKCSDGTRFDQEGMTAAHRSLPFGTKLLVMNRKTGDSCVVKVNDRGPFIGNRVIDLSKGAARQINMLGSGITMVDCIVLGK